ncbi:hypothetical protein ACRAWB_05000 [Leifsonia poae]|uniref:hypothetical protein n=1 Tax=Leifsonia poae TaxID=110933 RepID=UPI003D68BC9F
MPAQVTVDTSSGRRISTGPSGASSLSDVSRTRAMRSSSERIGTTASNSTSAPVAKVRSPSTVGVSSISPRG